MITVGIETSCDETSIGIVENSRILVNLVASQEKIHAKFGGIVPELASRAHLEKIVPLFNEGLKRCKILPYQIDAFGVTNTPGLKGSLLVGNAFAHGLAYALSKPIYNINHLYAHIAACFIEKKISFPCLGLVISGGQPNVFLLKDYTKFVQLGKTRDDACGEAFDKVGRMLNLPFPGGIHVEKIALRGCEDKIKFPVSYVKNSLDFSFSGIKTAVYYYILKHGLKEAPNIAAAFQKAVVDSIILKIEDALKLYQVEHFLFGGGVIRNNYLRKKIEKKLKEKNVEPVMARPDLCMDNGAKVAILTQYLIREKDCPDPYEIVVIPTK
ncbi:MAG: tRNA (adenosine(37)-N6)-threonylcarbamoyltransferase complex transferase subunit TsaD [Candidatus Omnitrophica bacterium]|nr:tRNA (adenosine(37)-N6)-threonylcarbamoyltransferase complex transferase subunit TsaD [Candidatus Omnitrophota bacterium]